VRKLVKFDQAMALITNGAKRVPLNQSLYLGELHVCWPRTAPEQLKLILRGPSSSDGFGNSFKLVLLGRIYPELPGLSLYVSTSR
jgi:hypothetical protein